MERNKPNKNEIIELFRTRGECTIILKSNETLTGVFRPHEEIKHGKIVAWKFTVKGETNIISIPHDQIAKIKNDVEENP